MGAVSLSRQTRETDIMVTLNLHGSGQAQIDTGIGFFDHMLTALTVHGGLDLSVRCQGDLAVDGHHTVEDVGIVLGQAIAKARGRQKRHQPLRHLLRPYGRSLGPGGAGFQRPAISGL